MEEDSRRFRGVFGVAVTWGVALSVLATGTLAVGLATGLVPSSIFGARELVAVAMRNFLAGGLAGGAFGWLISSRERRATLETMSMRRVALWGFVAAATVPTLLALAIAGPVLPFGVLVAGSVGFGAIGSLMGASTLRIARSGSAPLIAAGEDPARLMP